MQLTIFSVALLLSRRRHGVPWRHRLPESRRCPVSVYTHGVYVTSVMAYIVKKFNQLKYIVFCFGRWQVLQLCLPAIVSVHFPVPLPDCLCDASFRRYSPLSVKVVEKPNKCKSFLAPIFPGGRPQLFYSRLLARYTTRRLAKFGWIPFADLRLRSLAMQWNAEFTKGWWKLTSNLKPFVYQSSCCFETM